LSYIYFSGPLNIGVATTGGSPFQMSLLRTICKRFCWSPQSLNEQWNKFTLQSSKATTFSWWRSESSYKIVHTVHTIQNSTYSAINFYFCPVTFLLFFKIDDSKLISVTSFINLTVLKQAVLNRSYCLLIRKWLCCFCLFTADKQKQ
jgi:hypothetical protein